MPVSVAEVSDEAATLGWTEPYGVLVGRVVEGSGAEAAGLRMEDILLRLDGVRVQSAYHLVEAIGQMAPGSTVSLELWRDRRRLTVEVELGVRRDEPAR